MAEIYIGLMSGTSLDGVDGVLIEWSDLAPPTLQVHGHCHLPFDELLASELLALNQRGEDELHRAALAGNAVARRYAEVVQQLLARASRPASAVAAIGAHGQTVRHRPQQFDGSGYTLQLNNPSLLAELTGIAVIADLRSRDLAAGGQGAPLVPAFHRAMFGNCDASLAVLNLGGIANLTLLSADGSVLGFDCGPGNALLDHWVRLHRGQAFDDAGRWAASGRVIESLLSALQREPYFDHPPPKSTGRDLFHADWLAQRLALVGAADPADVQATLAELTAWACTRDLQRLLPQARELLVCGGGAFNDHLMARLAAGLPGMHVGSTAQRGLPPDQVEACAFAWLARAFMRREPASLPAVTGARGTRVLGCLYPA
ncbi:anhydro-N-acetylmuramic acid kinase [uncultured Piscinibacter sp.]|uniref:anhydro-N-acetylmuramic acid kinase n=1 Tax=uncultured Piscinibacter sp. TaxID=1131835 RepID=UPI00260EF526|nr:anhydro-N-acetylmuramic acid kinase [uncultured Piscinibacter sp.]